MHTNFRICFIWLDMFWIHSYLNISFIQAFNVNKWRIVNIACLMWMYVFGISHLNLLGKPAVVLFKSVYRIEPWYIRLSQNNSFAESPTPTQSPGVVKTMALYAILFYWLPQNLIYFKPSFLPWKVVFILYRLMGCNWVVTW